MTWEWYLCLQCVQGHTTDSKVGIKHAKYRHPVSDAWMWVNAPSSAELRRAWLAEHRDEFEARVRERSR